MPEPEKLVIPPSLDPDRKARIMAMVASEHQEQYYPNIRQRLEQLIKRSLPTALLFMAIWIAQGVNLQPLTWVAAFGGALSLNTLWEFLAHTGRPRWPGFGMFALVLLMVLPPDILVPLSYNFWGVMLLILAIALAKGSHKQLSNDLLVVMLFTLVAPILVAAFTYLPALAPIALPLRVLAIASTTVHIAVLALAAFKTIKPLPHAFS